MPACGRPRPGLRLRYRWYSGPLKHILATLGFPRPFCCFSSSGQFKSWRNDEPRRRALLADLIDIIKSHVYRKFGSAVENKHFHRRSPKNQKAFCF
jgi:hypothetical protein